MFGTSSVKHENKASTIDNDEVDSFSKKMEHWWDVDGPCRALHTLNDLRIPFVIEGMDNESKSASEPLENLKLLDVGCGGGILSEALAKKGASVTGIDASKELIDVATQHSLLETFKTRPTYHCTTMEDHAILYPNQYDGIVASEVIEHVNNQELFVQSCVQALKPNGRIFITTPSKTRLSQFLVIWFAENIVNSPPKGTHQYEKFISPEDLSRLLEKYGCKVEFTRGMFLNMWTNNWYWTSNQMFFYALQAIKQ